MMRTMKTNTRVVSREEEVQIVSNKDMDPFEVDSPAPATSSCSSSDASAKVKSLLDT